MDINSEKTCPSCHKKIKQIAMVCIHCHVNLIQYKKDNPSSNDLIDNSTQTTPNIPNKDIIQRTVKEPLDLVTRVDEPSIIGFIFTILLAVILTIYSIKEISEFIVFVVLAVKGDIETANNIVYLKMTDSSLRQKIILETVIRTLEVIPIIVSSTLVILFLLSYLGDTISYFKKIKLFNQKINANEFNTCSSCNHDQVHFHATSCPKCGSPNVNMYIKEMQRNLVGNIALFVAIMGSILQYLK